MLVSQPDTKSHFTLYIPEVGVWDVWKSIIQKSSQRPLVQQVPAMANWHNGHMPNIGQVSLGASEEKEQGILQAMIADMTFHVTDWSPKTEETTENQCEMTQKEVSITEWWQPPTIYLQLLMKIQQNQVQHSHSLGQDLNPVPHKKHYLQHLVRCM